MKAYKLSCPHCAVKLLLTVEDNKKPVISALNPEPEEGEINEENVTEEIKPVEIKQPKQMKLFYFEEDENE